MYYICTCIWSSDRVTGFDDVCVSGSPVVRQFPASVNFVIGELVGGEGAKEMSGQVFFAKVMRPYARVHTSL